MAKKKSNYNDKYIKIKEEMKLAILHAKQEEEKIALQRKKELISIISKINYLSIDDEVFAGALLFVKEILASTTNEKRAKINVNDNNDDPKLGNKNTKEENNKSNEVVHDQQDQNNIFDNICSSIDYVEELRLRGQEFFRKKSKTFKKQQKNNFTATDHPKTGT